jgi:hypothetical protein
VGARHVPKGFLTTSSLNLLNHPGEYALPIGPFCRSRKQRKLKSLIGQGRSWGCIPVLILLQTASDVWDMFWTGSLAGAGPGSLASWS